MDSSTEVSLSWKEFEQCAGEAFSSLLADTELADVTLACADDTLIKAHKLILCTSSPFFKNVLSKNLHSHPLVYMRGVEGRTMEALLSFIYRGEAKVLEADINVFLDTANELYPWAIKCDTEHRSGNSAPSYSCTPPTSHFCCSCTPPTKHFFFYSCTPPASHFSGSFTPPTSRATHKTKK